MKVLDTTLLIDLLKGKKEAYKVVEEDSVLFTTQINMYEVIRGLFLENASLQKVKEVISILGDLRVLQLNDDSVVKSSQISSDLIKKGKRIPDCDCMIVGISLANGINTIVTQNKKHFERIKEIKVESY